MGRVVWETSGKPARALRHGGWRPAEAERGLCGGRFVYSNDDGRVVRVVGAPDRIHIMVAGGSGGPQSADLTGWGSRRVTLKIDQP